MQRVPALAALLALVLLAAPAAALTPKQIDKGARKASQGLRQPVRFLASDKLAGRQNGSEGSVRAQEFLVKRLAKIAEPLGTGEDPYLQPFLRLGDVGTNVLAVIRGSELPDEYVMIGGHYDHLGVDCDPGEKPGDVICNGATDNAAGTAAVLAVAKAIAKLPEPPRRSVLIALWDAEEDGLEGAEYYVEEAPLVPLAQTVAYVNLDLLGATLIPSLERNTFAIASETGGAVLRDAIDAAAAAHPAVELTPLSEAFGQGRSDYRPFALAGVPTVFFGDGSSALLPHRGRRPLARRLEEARAAERDRLPHRHRAHRGGDDAGLRAAERLAGVRGRGRAPAHPRALRAGGPRALPARHAGADPERGVGDRRDRRRGAGGVRRPRRRRDAHPCGRLRGRARSASLPGLVGSASLQETPAMPVRERFDGVSVDTKANVYFDGRCVSHTIRLSDGTRKSVGVILPATLTFETAAPETMEIVAGRCRVKLRGSDAVTEYAGGQSFDVPGSSAFEIEALEPVHYVCHFG